MNKLALLIASLAACGGDPATPRDGYTLSRVAYNFVHVPGTTTCPQDLGDLEITNTGESSLILLVSADDVDIFDLLDFGDLDDLSPTSPDDLELEIVPGETAGVVPWFNCGQATSFTTNIRLTPEGDQEPATIPVTATIE